MFRDHRLSGENRDKDLFDRYAICWRVNPAKRLVKVEKNEHLVVNVSAAMVEIMKD